MKNVCVEFDGKDDEYRKLVEDLKPMITEINRLADYAVKTYKPLVNSILAGEIKGETDIAYIMDYMLDFCWSESMLRLFRRLCKGIYDDHPQLVEDYVRFYQEMWEDQE